MAEQLVNSRRRRLLAASEVDGGEDGAAREDVEGPVLEKGRNGSGVLVDRQREGCVPIVGGLLHVDASLRDEPLDELELVVVG